MNESQPPYNSSSFSNRGERIQTPNSTEVMVLGILSIAFCWCWGLVSIILAIITLVLAKQGEQRYRLEPSLYTEISYRNLKTGKTCAIIGLCLALVTVIAMVAYFVVFGSMFYTMFKSGMQY